MLRLDFKEEGDNISADGFRGAFYNIATHTYIGIHMYTHTNIHVPVYTYKSIYTCIFYINVCFRRQKLARCEQRLLKLLCFIKKSGFTIAHKSHRSCRIQGFQL